MGRYYLYTFFSPAKVENNVCVSLVHEMKNLEKARELILIIINNINLFLK